MWLTELAISRGEMNGRRAFKPFLVVNLSVIRFLFVSFGSGTHACIPGEGVDPVAFDR